MTISTQQAAASSKDAYVLFYRRRDCDAGGPVAEQLTQPAGQIPLGLAVETAVPSAKIQTVTKALATSFASLAEIAVPVHRPALSLDMLDIRSLD